MLHLLLGGGLRLRREFFVGDEPGWERYLGAQAPAHTRTDAECVAILHGHDWTPPPLSPSRCVGQPCGAGYSSQQVARRRHKRVTKSLADAAAACTAGGR